MEYVPAVVPPQQKNSTPHDDWYVLPQWLSQPAPPLMSNALAKAACAVGSKECQQYSLILFARVHVWFDRAG